MTPGTAPRAAIRVASYNVRDLLDDRAAAARVVRAVDPDLLCLQEVPRRLLASRAVARFAVSCGMSWSGAHRGSGGTTILTSGRVQVLASSHHRLPVRPFMRRRGYAVMSVALDAHRTLLVVSLHLSLDPAERRRHAASVLAALAAGTDSVAPGQAVVIAGDLNEGPEGAAFRLLADRFAVVSDAVPTYPSRHPERVIDVILASAGFQAVPGAPAPLDEGDLVAASDHRPVWVDLSWPATS